MLWINPILTLISNAPVAFIIWYTVYSSKVIGIEVHRRQQAHFMVLVV